MNLMSSRDTYKEAPRERGNVRRKRVLLVGASGFVGSNILRALQTRTDTIVTILARRPVETSVSLGATVIVGSLSDPSSLFAATKGINVLINATSYVGSDPDQARRVNLDGTLAVLRACEGSTVSRIIQISTTAVYGSGPHQGVRPWEVVYGPESVASQSRAMAEQAVMAAGGVVVRPNLIYGCGDRWFIPGAVRMFKTLGATIEGGRALISVIDVKDLGILIAALATEATAVSGAFHAAHPIPISLRELLTTISGNHLAELSTAQSTSLDDAISKLRPAGFRPHQVNMLGADHHYLSQELWSMAGYPPPTFRLSPETVSWYQQQV
jgi:2-alkyl-3-oxoalkanoate reductase